MIWQPRSASARYSSFKIDFDTLTEYNMRHSFSPKLAKGGSVKHQQTFFTVRVLYEYCK